MSKKSLYIIIVILVLCIMGVISIPSLQDINNCENVDNTGKVYFRFGPISMPLKVGNCERG